MTVRAKAAPAETWGELGPAMRALPNERWRQFVRQYVTGKPGHGAAVRAFRACGLGKGSSSLHQAREAYKMLHDDRMIAASAPSSMCAGGLECGSRGLARLVAAALSR
jgi:hypothetical protein